MEKVSQVVIVNLMMNGNVSFQKMDIVNIIVQNNLDIVGVDLFFEVSEKIIDVLEVLKLDIVKKVVINNEGMLLSLVQEWFVVLVKFFEKFVKEGVFFF